MPLGKLLEYLEYDGWGDRAMRELRFKRYVMHYADGIWMHGTLKDLLLEMPLDAFRVAQVYSTVPRLESLVKTWRAKRVFS